jgi:hypothetical protein
MPKAIAKIGTVVVRGLIKLLGAFGGVKLPKQPDTQVPIKQSVKQRRSAFGRVKVGGLYALFEANEKISVDVLALLHGKSQGFVQHYLDDDKVTVNALTGGVTCPEDPRKYDSGGAPGDRVFIFTRLGAATETAYAQVTAQIPSWDADHRGDGVTSMALICKQSKAKKQAEDFPNGLPKPSPVIDAQLVFDPRDEAQVQGDKSTYAFSRNGALHLLAYLTDAEGGMGHDYASKIAPHLDTWIATADDCDLAEATIDGTEPRYQCGGSYDHDTAPGDVIAAILSTFDGFLAPAGDGAFVLRPGRFVAPTVTLRDQHVLRYSLQHFLPDEQATNEYVVSFIDPAADFNQGDAGVIRDEADIAARGVVRSTGLELDWVQSASQAIRLAKRRLSRSTQQLRGTITTNLYGLQVPGERYLTLDLSDNPLLADLVVEVTGPVQMDLANGMFSFPWIAADVTIDDGDPGAEVTPPPTPDPRPVPAGLAAPTITGVTPIYEHASSSDTGARLSIDVSAPLDADVEWLFRWRVVGSTFYHEGASTDVDDGAAVTLVTGFVTANADLEVEVAYVTAAGVSPFSAAFPVTVAAPTDDFEDAIATAGGKLIEAAEAITAPALVNVFDSAGEKVRKADATTAGKEAVGFILTSVALGADAKVFFEGVVSGLAGLTIGATHYLATTPGEATPTAPAASGNLVQPIGVAISATELDFEAGQSVELR